MLKNTSVDNYRFRYSQTYCDGGDQSPEEAAGITFTANIAYNLPQHFSAMLMEIRCYYVSCNLSSLCYNMSCPPFIDVLLRATQSCTSLLALHLPCANRRSTLFEL